MYPKHFNNKTNGVTRRWLLQANPKLASEISAAIGDGWNHRPESAQQVESTRPMIRAFDAFLASKREAKVRNEPGIFGSLRDTY
jgi:glycogen phosphorylase